MEFREEPKAENIQTKEKSKAPINMKSTSAPNPTEIPKAQR